MWFDKSNSTAPVILYSGNYLADNKTVADGLSVYEIVHIPIVSYVLIHSRSFPRPLKFICWCVRFIRTLSLECWKEKTKWIAALKRNIKEWCSNILKAHISFVGFYSLLFFFLFFYFIIVVIFLFGCCCFLYSPLENWIELVVLVLHDPVCSCLIAFTCSVHYSLDAVIPFGVCACVRAECVYVIISTCSVSLALLLCCLAAALVLLMFYVEFLCVWHICCVRRRRLLILLVCVCVFFSFFL